MHLVIHQEYYPFGMEMPGRIFTASSTEGYRYGFNGKEQDTEGEWGGLTHYDYGFRIYNPGIGRFLSVDPLSPEYPWYTPYQFAGNKPIAFIDLDGLEEYRVIHYLDNQGALTGLKIQLSNLNAPYVIKRVSTTKPFTPVGSFPLDDNPPYYPASQALLQERIAFNGIRNTLLRQWINGALASRTVEFPIMPLNPNVLPRTASVLSQSPIEPIPIELELPEMSINPPIQRRRQPTVISRESLNVQFERNSGKVLNASQAVRNVREVVSRLAEDGSLRVQLSVSLGNSNYTPTQNPDLQAVERRQWGMSGQEILDARSRRLYNAFIGEARRQGVDDSRIGQPTIVNAGAREGEATVVRDN